MEEISGNGIEAKEVGRYNKATKQQLGGNEQSKRRRRNYI